MGRDPTRERGGAPQRIAHTSLIPMKPAPGCAPLDPAPEVRPVTSSSLVKLFRVVQGSRSALRFCYCFLQWKPALVGFFRMLASNRKRKGVLLLSSVSLVFPASRPRQNLGVGCRACFRCFFFETETPSMHLARRSSLC